MRWFPFFFQTKSLKLTHFYTYSTLQFELATFPMLYSHTGQCKTRRLPKWAFWSTSETVHRRAAQLNAEHLGGTDLCHPT